ncbi:DUF5590 domain-containing protein [Alkalihalobacillus sp. NPDC078783]
MKKWIITSCVGLVVVVLALFIYAYTTVRAPLADGYDMARDKILNEDVLESVRDVSYYHGEDAFYVVYGMDQDGDQAIAWVSQDEENDTVTVFKESDGISAEDASSLAESAVNPSSIQSIKLGKEGNTPLYEVKYRTESNQQGYYYVAFQDGSFIKRFSLNND